MNATEKEEVGVVSPNTAMFQSIKNPIRFILRKKEIILVKFKGKKLVRIIFYVDDNKQFSIYVSTYLSFSFSVFLVEANYYTSDYPESFVPIGVRCGVFNVSFSVDGTHIFRADVFLVVLERGHRLEE